MTESPRVSVITGPWIVSLGGLPPVRWRPEFVSVLSVQRACCGRAPRARRRPYPQCGGLSRRSCSSFSVEAWRAGSGAGVGSDPAGTSVVTRRRWRPRPVGTSSGTSARCDGSEGSNTAPSGASAWSGTGCGVRSLCRRGDDRDRLSGGRRVGAEHDRDLGRDGVRVAEQFEGVHPEVVPSESSQ